MSPKDRRRHGHPTASRLSSFGTIMPTSEIWQLEKGQLEKGQLEKGQLGTSGGSLPPSGGDAAYQLGVLTASKWRWPVAILRKSASFCSAPTATTTSNSRRKTPAALHNGRWTEIGSFSKPIRATFTCTTSTTDLKSRLRSERTFNTTAGFRQTGSMVVYCRAPSEDGPWQLWVTDLESDDLDSVQITHVGSNRLPDWHWDEPTTH